MGAPGILRSAVAHLEKGDWQAAHPLLQQDEEDPLYCWAHGIAHVIEGDLENARYWYGEAKRPFPKDYALADEIAALKDACR